MDLPLPLLLASVAGRTVVILVALVVGIRIFGRRNLGEMNLLDIVMVSLLGNAVQNALTYGSGELTVGIVSATILLIADRVIGFVFARDNRVEKGFYGEPVMLVHHGQFERDRMERQGVTEEEVLAAVHSQGLRSVKQVRLAVLENDGTISIVPEEQKG